MRDQIVVAFLFICAVAAVYVLAAGALLRRLLRRRRHAPRPVRAVLWSERVVLALAVAGLACFAYGYLIEPYWPEVTRVRIESRKLTGATRPVRLVHISDLHCDAKPRLETSLPDIIARERPDFIVFTGDSVNSHAGIPVLKSLLARLSIVAPTYVVRGNWDVSFRSAQELYGDTGVRELNGAAERIEVAGASLTVTGLPDGAHDRIDEALTGAQANTFNIFLYHRPDQILEIARREQVDLYCAGHTHGGQVALPFYGALITLSRFGKRYEAGLYREGRTWLYVTRGVGMEGGNAPRVRFMARPEVTVIDLVPAS